MPDICICKVINDRAYDLQDPTCHVRHASMADIQLLMSAEYIVHILPEIKVFGWGCMYINGPSLMADLKWQISSVGNVQILYKNGDKM